MQNLKSIFLLLFGVLAYLVHYCELFFTVFEPYLNFDVTGVSETAWFKREKMHEAIVIKNWKVQLSILQLEEKYRRCIVSLVPLFKENFTLFWLF